MKLVLQNIRGSYVFVDKPRKEKDGSDGKYSMQILIKKDDPQVKKIKAAIKKVLVEKFGEAAAQKLAKYKLPLRDGDEERDDEEYQGMYFMNANGNKRPGIVNRNNEPADADDLEEYCYSGAYFHASINFYAFDSKDGGKPGVAVGLNNVMLRKKGERLDGSTSAASDFAEYAEEGEGFDMDEDEEDDL